MAQNLRESIPHVNKKMQVSYIQGTMLSSIDVKRSSYMATKIVNTVYIDLSAPDFVVRVMGA